MIASSRRLAGLLGTVVLVAAACGGAKAVPSSTPVVASSPSGSGSAATAAAPIAGGLLEKVKKAGVLVVSTDPNYAPQSFLKPDGTFQGFDIDVATEIAKRLGVTVKFVTPSWDVITAGKWVGRFDVSVGSMTITVPRQQVLDFSDPYYYTPAQMTATTKSGITALDGLNGKTICVASATTYSDWLQGKLQSVSLGPVANPPTGVTLKTLDTDQLCAQAIKAGQNVGEGFLSASTVIDQAITNGTPIVKVGSAVFTEQLAASVDKSGPVDTDFVAAVSKIIQDMHADGTLTRFSMTWFKADLTKPPA
ncbi:MAG TPA: transporter substrate-binding domain-containing protein [Candidatus Limnocylindrales bacterium]|nr:transporter substrate-binding domain-containing protein [Candidatus Limnocylindrales bacterium]